MFESNADFRIASEAKAGKRGIHLKRKLLWQS
jgi:hypothetical protein